ncbi:ABC transporter substrate-binding protein [Haloferax sp. ATB1]|uniref:ABC transporter substrate-binding protein n=1 Tax=Haloferax sp. ATB1 TaxID=1508454 RepID=UPI0012FE914F|nr:extracellular solute-binding protein [Haloferax sp. ATB1]
MSDRDSLTSRRKLLQSLGVGSVAALGGCLGGSNSGGNASTQSGGDDTAQSQSDSGFAAQAENIDFENNWEQRRSTTLDEWPLESRQDIPGSDSMGEPESWKETAAVKDAPWQPPEGWEDTPAGDVETIQILNHGALEYDPATAFAYALFEERTGINIEVLPLPVDQAVPKKNAVFSSGQSNPHGLMVRSVGSFPSFVQNGYLEETPVYPAEEMWDMYIPSMRKSFSFDGEAYLTPGILQGSLVHTRPDMMREQGVDEETVSAIVDGSYSWDDLETVMEAFEGSDKFAWAYRGGSRNYTFRDWTMMYYEAGGSFVDESGYVSVNDEAGIAALSKMVEWKENGWVPSGVSSFSQGDLADRFMSGQLAMVPVSGDLIPSAVEKFGQGGNYAPTTPPEGGSEMPNPTKAGMASPNGMSINAQSDVGHKLAMALYQDCRLSFENMWMEAVVEGNQTYNPTVFEQATETDSMRYPEVRKQAMEVVKVEVFPQMQSIAQTVSEQLQMAISGGKSAENALNAAQETIDTTLGQ